MAEAMKGDLGRRVHERVAVDTPATLLTTGSERRAGRLQNVSMGGAFVELPVEDLPENGSGLLLSFRLPGGFHVRVYGVVAWKRDAASAEGPTGVGVQFLGLDGINREFISYHLSGGTAEGQEVPAEVVERYRVLVSGARISIYLQAALNPNEGELLDSLVAERLRGIENNKLVLYFEARLGGPASRETLGTLRRCLGRLSRCPQLRGVLVGPNSTGMVQLRRLAREVGIADSLVSFEDRAMAQEFCAQMEAS